MRLTSKAKASVSAVLMIMALVLLCSCSVSDKKDLIKYAKNNYGACEFIREEHSGSGKDEYRSVYLKDKETGIEYKVTSSMSGLNIDGSIFGYTEDKSSDFPKLYTDYVLGLAGSEISALEREYDFTFEYPKVIFDNRVSGSEAKKAVKELCGIIDKYDTKNMCESEYMVYAEGKVYIGVYDSDKHVWSPSKEYEVIDYVHSHYDSGAKFSDSIGAYLPEFLSYEEIDRLLPDRDGNTSGRAYYFKDSQGDTIVAIDLRDWDVPGGGIRIFRDTAHGMEEIK